MGKNRLVLATWIALASCAPSGSGERPSDIPPLKPSAVLAPSAPPSAPAHLAGSRITATSFGALVIDADSGVLFAIDPEGAVLAQRAIGRAVGLLTYDPERRRVYVADRSGDRLVVLDSDKLEIVAEWQTPVEPFGVALSPDRQTVFVTTIADKSLVAYNALTGTESWRTAVSAGARGLAVAPSGTRALVSSIASNALELVELDGEHRRAPIAFVLDCEGCEQQGAFARGSGSVRFIDKHRAIATYQRSIPESLQAIHQGRYSGGSKPPITQHVAFLRFPSDRADHRVKQEVAQIVPHQPRAFLWDPRHDTLSVVGLGSETLLQLPGISKQDNQGIEASASNFSLRASKRCGPDGIALTNLGEILIWCSFSRTVLHLNSKKELTESSPLVGSKFTPKQHRGLVLFYSSVNAVNRDRALACASCHPEGGADGLSWKIGNQALQTPSLAGRIRGTAPYKWDGADPTLAESLTRTVGRLGGSGLSSEQRAALIAFLESMPRPRSPTLDRAAVSRGEKVFQGDGGCFMCHDDVMFSDGNQYQFISSLLRADTPSLVGIGSSAPYYHDGSAETLEALLSGAGSVKGMADFASLSDTQRADLLVYLRSL